MKQIINEANNKLLELKKLNEDEMREIYYIKLGLSEKYTNDVRNKLVDINKINNTESSHEIINKLLECIVVYLGEANLYREENYILISTVIHVVKTESCGG